MKSYFTVCNASLSSQLVFQLKDAWYSQDIYVINVNNIKHCV